MQYEAACHVLYAIFLGLPNLIKDSWCWCTKIRRLHLHPFMHKHAPFTVKASSIVIEHSYRLQKQPISLLMTLSHVVSVLWLIKYHFCWASLTISSTLGKSTTNIFQLVTHSCLWWSTSLSCNGICVTATRPTGLHPGYRSNTRFNKSQSTLHWPYTSTIKPVWISYR